MYRTLAPIGVFADGTPFGYDTVRGGSFILSGNAGAGKTVAMRTLVGGALIRGTEVLLLWPGHRLRHEYGTYAEDSSFRVAKGPSPSAIALGDLLHRDGSEPRILVAVDDYTTLMDGGVVGESRVSTIARPILREKLRDLWERRDELNIDFAFAAQQPSFPFLYSTYEKSGTTALVFGDTNYSQVNMAFGSTDGTLVQPVEVRRGQVLARHPNGELQTAEVWARDL
jgi:hypothetical protein